jgi:hypothetical protein
MSPTELQLRSRRESATAYAYALLEEYSFVRREAQAEADIAYDHWCLHATRETYAVYLAARDRADAAQDDLASFTRRLTAA